MISAILRKFRSVSHMTLDVLRGTEHGEVFASAEFFWFADALTKSPGSFTSSERAFETSSILAMVLKRTVGGIEILRPPRVLSFFIESLPEIQGTRNAFVQS